MSVDRLPSGTFRARITIDGTRHVATFATREEAQEWEIVTRARAITGSLPARATVSEYAARWLLGYETAPRNTRVFHETNLKHITAALGSLAASKVTPTDITRMLNGVTSTRTPALAERVYRTASAMFGSAAADGLCPSGSPVRSKRHRPRRQRNDHPVRERAQARAMLLQFTGWQRDTALVQLGLGARYGEIAGLTPLDVDIARGVVHIRRRCSAHGNTVRATKNHRRRTLELPAIPRSPMERLIREAGDPPPLPELEDRELDAQPFRRRWLVQTTTGRPPSLTAYNRALAAACSGAGVPRVSSRGLRHTYVSWMIDEGSSADKIAWMSRSLDQRRTAILTEIAQLGPAMPGSLVFRHNRCARTDCHCRADPPQLHGPYPAWTRKIDDKTVTRSLRTDQADRYQPWFDNARRLRELTDQLRQLAIEQAQADGDWPDT